MLIDLNLIHTFLEVTKTKNLHMAAQRLDITQSAVSQRIAALEAQVGKSLFLRRGGMELNSVGERFLTACRGYHETVDHLERWILEESESLSGDVRLMVTYGMAGRLLPQFLKNFLAQHDQARFLCLSVESSPQVEEAVLNGTVDVGVMVALPQKPSLKAIKLFANNAVYMMCSPDHPFAKRKKVTYEEILTTRLLIHSHKGSRTQQLIFKGMGKKYDEMKNVVRLPDMDTCKQHALAGVGIAFLASMYIFDEVRDGRLIKLPGFKVSTPLYLISRSEKHEIPLVREFKKEFVEYCRELDKKWK